MSHKPLSQSPNGFNENDERYMCCCSLIHSKKAVKLIYYIGYAIVILQGIGGILRKKIPKEYKIMFTAFVIFNVVVTIPALVCIYYAMKKENKNYLIWPLILSVLAAVFWILIMIFAISFASSFQDIMKKIEENEEGEKTDEETRKAAESILYVIVIGLIVACGAISVMFCWIFWFMKKYYNYLRDKADYGRSAALPLN